MTIAFRAATGGVTGSSPLTVTVPAVLAADTVLLMVTVDTAGSTFSASTSGITVPVQVSGSLVTGPNVSFALYQFTAVSGDAGATLSFNASASSTPAVAVLAAYSGAGLVQAADWQSFTAGVSTTAVSPSFTPAVAGSWGIAFGGNNSLGSPTYTPGTARVTDAFGVSSAYDSNAAASPVGGGTWTSGSDVWWGYTVALRPPAAPSSAKLLMAGII